MTDYGITLKSYNSLHKIKENWENKSIIEDFENHFHVDWLVKYKNKKAFKLGSKTLYLLAKKFEDEKFSGIRFWYYFQTPKLGMKQAKANNFCTEEEHLLSDKLSFNTIRNKENVVDLNNIEDEYGAILVIDI